MNRGTGAAFLLLLFSLSLFSGCISPTSVGQFQTPKDNYADRPDTNVSALAFQMHALVNQERAKSGIAPLSWDDGLRDISLNHSADMVKRQYFSHYDPDGKGPPERATAAGYNCTKILEETVEYTTYAEGIGENLFKNNLYDYTLYEAGVPYYYHWNTQEEIARSTVSGWMNSTEHRMNILEPHYEQEGIGIVISPDDGVYITENFC